MNVRDCMESFRASHRNVMDYRGNNDVWKAALDRYAADFFINLVGN